MQTLQHVFCLFVCLFGVYRPTREFFTHVETSTCSNEVTVTCIRETWPIVYEIRCVFLKIVNRI